MNSPATDILHCRAHYFCTMALHILGAVFACVVLISPILPAQDVVVSGTVRDKRTGTPLASAMVKLSTVEGATIDTVRTDNAGEWSYTFRSTDAGHSPVIPVDFVLGQNYPNPFNPTTRIPFRVQRQSYIRLSVHNILGQLLDVREYSLQAGEYVLPWQGKGSAGVLFYSIELDGVRYTRKMVQMEGGGSGGFGELTRYAGAIPLRLQKRSLEYCQVRGTSFGYEPESLQVALVGTPRADFSLESIHDRACVIDLHNDVMEKIVASQFQYDLGVRHSVNHTDLPRLRDGGVDVQMFSIYVDPTAYNPSEYYSRAIQFIDSLASQVTRNSSDIGFAMKADSVIGLNGQGRIAGMLLLEGGHCIDANLEKLKTFYQKGVRCMTITWNNSTSWAVSAQDSRSATVGLSEFGKEVIRAMDSLGMIVDVSHVGKKTVEDILSIAQGPVIASHSGCAVLCNHYRNLTDDQIKAIARTGGVIGVVFYPPFLSSFGTVTVETVANHIDHIRDLVGTDYIALGSDFDGIERTPVGLGDVSRFPELTNTLLRRGYTREEVRKILGENFLRVLRSVCK